MSFHKHINDKINHASKGISLAQKFLTILQRTNLLNNYILLIRPLLDYADVIFDQTCNVYFSKKINSGQYNAALAIKGAIKGSFTEKLY